MLCLILLFEFVALAVARTPQVRPMVPMLDGRIIGGHATSIEALPYQISLRSHGSHICGGSVISTTRVLTAAHCTAASSASSLSVRAGTTFHGSGGYVVNVESICAHPQYNPRTTDNDVSVLKLASALYFSNVIQPIALVEIGRSEPTGSLAVVSGWGTNQHGVSAGWLMELWVPKISQQDCKNAYGQSAITDNMICHGYLAGGNDACQGDSGGPLAIGRIQVGILSWGAGCAQPGKPGVYTDPSKANIQNHINSC